MFRGFRNVGFHDPHDLRIFSGCKIRPMTPDVSELLKKALALPPEARAALAGSLLESLDDTVDASAEEEWSREIARRIQELDSGKVKPIPWAEARRQISALRNGT
jgi:putative addiction module component (TIGR02574 family)